MSANSEDPPPKTITSLPTELITRIVQLSPPRPSWDNAVERSAHLRTLALVCRAFRGPAQDELFRNVVLRSAGASRAFVAVLESRAGARFALTPRSLRTGVEAMPGFYQETMEISVIIKRCSRLESMWLLRILGVDVPTLTSGTAVSAVFCFGCSFISTISRGASPTSLPTSPLTRLGIIECYGQAYLDPTCFQSLKSLDSNRAASEKCSLSRFINSLGGQLSSLCTDSVTSPTGLAALGISAPSEEVDTELLINLRTLDSRLYLDDLTLFLSSLPSPLRHLRVQAQTGPTSYDWAQRVIRGNFKVSSHSCLQELEHLRCPGDGFDSPLRGPELQAELAAIKPELTLDFDEGHYFPKSRDSIDAKFNPSFWDFATIASLATELIIKIVRLSSPKPSWDNATERSAHLRNLALVCQVFREPAQEELFRHVVLRSVAASRLFVDVLKSDAGARFASTPRSLRVGAWSEWWAHQERFSIPFILKVCSRLQSMWLLVIHSPDIVALVSGTDLKELFCFGCSFTIVPHGRGLEALQLTRLGIRHCYDSSFLDPTSFPNVKSLDVSLPGEVNIFDQYMFANSLGGQLSALCIGEADAAAQHIAVRFIDSDVDPSRFKNLLILDSRLGFEDVRRTFLSSVPPTSNIRHLRSQAPHLARPIKPQDNYTWGSLFIPAVRVYLKVSNNLSLKRLEHVRYGTADGNPAMSTENAKALEDELKGHRPDVRLSFDEDNHLSRNLEYGLIDAKFNPSFWAFVDDAEAAEEAKRRDSEGV